MAEEEGSHEPIQGHAEKPRFWNTSYAHLTPTMCTTESMVSLAISTTQPTSTDAHTDITAPSMGIADLLRDLPKSVSFPLDPSRLSIADHHDLEQYGGLVLPPTPLRSLILQAFAEFVYPQLPVVNLCQLIDTIDSNAQNASEPVSLVLFQTIMFAGVACIPGEQLNRHGWSSHFEARRQLFNRVEACFHVSVHHRLCDPVSLIQSLILMTLWYDPGRDQRRDSHHWMRIALNLAGDIGMLRPRAHASHPRDPARERLWRRIAWTMYARDRIIQLGARRPALIHPNDFTLAPLSIDDFELQPLLYRRPSCLPAECTLFRDPCQLFNMAEIIIEQIGLLRHIDEVWNAHEQLKSSISRGSAASMVMACDARLKAKRTEFLRHEVPTSLENQQQKSAMVQRAVLKLLCNATISALHRPLVLRESHGPQPQLDPRILQQCHATLEDATQQITGVASLMLENDLWLCLPASVVASLLSALIVHIISTKATSEDVRNASLRGFHQCLRLLARLRSRHANADDTYRFLEGTIMSMRNSTEPESFEVKELANILEQTSTEQSNTKSLVNAGLPETDSSFMMTAADDGSMFQWLTHDNMLPESPLSDFELLPSTAMAQEAAFPDMYSLFDDQMAQPSRDDSSLQDYDFLQLISQQV